MASEPIDSTLGRQVARGATGGSGSFCSLIYLNGEERFLRRFDWCALVSADGADNGQSRRFQHTAAAGSAVIAFHSSASRSFLLVVVVVVVVVVVIIVVVVVTAFRNRPPRGWASVVAFRLPLAEKRRQRTRRRPIGPASV